MDSNLLVSFGILCPDLNRTRTRNIRCRTIVQVEEAPRTFLGTQGHTSSEGFFLMWTHCELGLNNFYFRLDL